MKFLPFVWRNLMRRKLRTTLTFLSILVAFLLYGFLGAIRQAFTAGVDMADANRLVVRHKVSIIQMLPVTYKERIERIPGVVAAVHQVWFGGIYRDPNNFFPSFPVVPDEFLEMFKEFSVPEDQRQAFRQTRTGAVVGRATATRFGWKIGDRVSLNSPIWQRTGGSNTWEFDIVGIYDGVKKGSDTTGFLFRYDYFDEARALAKGEVGWFTVRVKDPTRAAAIARAIDEEFANSAYETKAEPEGAFVQAWAKQIGDIATILIAILGAVFFTILLVAGNTMAQSVRERTEELGVMKALGFTNRLVLAIVLGESLLLSFAGGALGLGLAWALISLGNPMPGMLQIWILPDRDLFVGAGLVAALGFVTGIFPALQAMHLRIADALRRQT